MRRVAVGPYVRGMAKATNVGDAPLRAASIDVRVAFPGDMMARVREDMARLGVASCAEYVRGLVVARLLAMSVVERSSRAEGVT